MKIEIDQLGAAVAGVAGKALASGACLSVPVRRIVTFHLSSLTDLIWTLPALSAMRDSFPGAHITSVARPPLTALLRATASVDEVLSRPRGGLSSQAGLMARLHGAHFDIAVAFSPSRNTTLLAWSTGAAIRAGYEGAKMDALLTHRVSPAASPFHAVPALAESVLHATGNEAAPGWDAPGWDAPGRDAPLALAREIGCATHRHDALGLIAPPAEANRRVARWLESAGIEGEFLVVAAQSGRKKSDRQWTSEGWSEALSILAGRWPVILVGTAPQPALTLDERVLDWGGRTDLPTLAALCARARLACGIDCGALHLAAAMGTPTVALFHAPAEVSRAPRGALNRSVLLDGKSDAPGCDAPGRDAHEAERVVAAVRETIGV